MKIFSAEQTRAWDAYTIAHEPLPSIDLMERAAAACTHWLLPRWGGARPFVVLCGKGNNGGDGLAIARQLIDYGRSVSVFILDSGKAGSPDFLQNLARLQQLSDRIELIESTMPDLAPEAIIIDALFGTGLRGPLAGTAAGLVASLNTLSQPVVSIDLPSGLLPDAPSAGRAVVRAAHTLTFGAPKLGQLLQENGDFIGHLHVLDIGLSAAYASNTSSPYEYVDAAFARALFRPRQPFAHKGRYGHALLVAGSYGKMGAALMAATACLRGGAGLLSCHSPRCGFAVLQGRVPEAMFLPDAAEEHLTTLPENLDSYAAIGIGPGIGTEEATVELLEAYLRTARCPLVLDADALNILARRNDLLPLVPKGSLLTPHPKEFDRLFGEHSSDFERIHTASTQAMALGSVVLLKGHHTFSAAPDGRGYFNSTGNAGMAKGGSGDVLTGLLTALLAQGYPAAEAAALGVWLHGKAGDAAAQRHSLESLLPTDLAAELGTAFRALYADNANEDL